MKFVKNRILFSNLLRKKVSSDITELNKLRNDHQWIPNEKQVRPNEKKKKEKFDYLNKEIIKYESEEDFILITVFSCDFYSRLNKLKAIKPTEEKKIFCKNKFEYEVPAETLHYIMWYYPSIKKEEEIVKDINEEIKKVVKSDNYDFVFYENPKMNINSVIKFILS
jgi:hypothetical protein